jgi:hypothetical protein
MQTSSKSYSRLYLVVEIIGLTFIKSTCKQWNAIGKKLFSSVSISALVSDDGIYPIVTRKQEVKNGSRYSIWKGTPIPCSSVVPVALYGSTLFVAFAPQAHRFHSFEEATEKGTKLVLYHNHAHSYSVH